MLRFAIKNLSFCEHYTYNPNRKLDFSPAKPNTTNNITLKLSTLKHETYRRYLGNVGNSSTVLNY